MLCIHLLMWDLPVNACSNHNSLCLTIIPVSPEVSQASVPEIVFSNSSFFILHIYSIAKLHLFFSIPRNSQTSEKKWRCNLFQYLGYICVF